MKIDVRPRNRNAPRPKEKSCEGFRQWQRGRDCACGGRNPACGGKIVSAHGPHKASKGMATKCSDIWTMPLSDNCHKLQHAIGWQSFAARYLPGPALEVCAAYFKAWPGRLKWERENGKVDT